MQLVFLQVAYALTDERLFGVIVNVVLLVFLLRRYYSRSRPAFVFIIASFLTLVVMMPRGVAMPVDQAAVMWLRGALCFLILGVLAGDRLSAVFYLIVVFFVGWHSVLILQDVPAELEAPRILLTTFLGIHTLSALVVITVLIRVIQQSEGLLFWVRRHVSTTVETFAAFKPLEWLGVFILVLSMLLTLFQSGFVQDVRDSLTRIFVGLYRGAVEPIADVIVAEIAYWLRIDVPGWLLPTCLVVGFLLRAAHLHMARYGDLSLWRAVWIRAANPNSELMEDIDSSGLSSREVTYAVAGMWLIGAWLSLSLFGLNPTMILAPNGGMTPQSAAAAAFTGLAIGVVVSLARPVVERTSGWSKRAMNGVRVVVLFPALILVAPFVAWRVLLASLLLVSLILIVDLQILGAAG